MKQNMNESFQYEQMCKRCGNSDRNMWKNILSILHDKYELSQTDIWISNVAELPPTADIELINRMEVRPALGRGV